eukprot:SAG31_NODE_9784_length_1227_cov_7.479610_1_plen_64_part_00
MGGAAGERGDPARQELSVPPTCWGAFGPGDMAEKNQGAPQRLLNIPVNDTKGTTTYSVVATKF